MAGVFSIPGAEFESILASVGASNAERIASDGTASHEIASQDTTSQHALWKASGANRSARAPNTTPLRSMSTNDLGIDNVVSDAADDRATNDETHAENKAARSEVATGQSWRRFVGDETNPTIPVIADAILSGSNCPTPIVFFGASGTGKSLLARNLLRMIAAREQWSSDRYLWLTATDFARQITDALETNSRYQYRIRFNQLSALAIDDLDELVDRPSAQRELRLLLDEFEATDRLVLLTARSNPTLIDGLETGLASRLTNGLSIGVNPPGYEARASIVESFLQERNLSMDHEAAEVLLSGPTETIPNLIQALNRIIVARKDTTTLAPAVSLGEVRLALECEAPTPPSLRQIIGRVARATNLKSADVVSQSRKQSIVRARGIAMWLARRLTNESLEKIGKAFGGRDHTTVMHACRKIEKESGTDANLERTLNDLIVSLQNESTRR